MSCDTVPYDPELKQPKLFLNMHPLFLITGNILQKKFTSNIYTINFSLHWQLKIKIMTEGTGTVGPREVLVPYKTYMIQNTTGLLEEIQFLS